MKTYNIPIIVSIKAESKERAQNMACSMMHGISDSVAHIYSLKTWGHPYEYKAAGKKVHKCGD